MTSSQWQQCCDELPSTKTLSMPRRYDVPLKTEIQTTELHVFTDASESAYCAAACMRVISVEGECTVILVASKTRVASLKSLLGPD